LDWTWKAEGLTLIWWWGKWSKEILGNSRVQSKEAYRSNSSSIDLSKCLVQSEAEEEKASCLDQNDSCQATIWWSKLLVEQAKEWAFIGWKNSS
jgi:hypothetical protein